MHRYLIASGILFAFISAAWLVRFAIGIPIQVGSFVVPLWPSAFPVLVAGSLAAWAFRLAAQAPSPHA